VDIEIIGANQPANYEIAQRLAGKMTHIPGAVDVHVQQAFDAPTLYMDLDRTRSQYVGMQAREWLKICSCRSPRASRLRRVSGWTRGTCQLQRGGANTAITAMTRFRRCKILPSLEPARRRDAADSGEPGAHEDGGAPASISHYNVQPMINVYASVYQRDLEAWRRKCGGWCKEAEKRFAARKPHRDRAR